MRFLKRFAEAEKEAEDLTTGSMNANHFYWYGRVLADQNKHKKAVESFQKAIQLDPNDY